jgi:hypothetical protein
MSKEKGAVKYDAGKPRYDLVPWDAFDEVVKALTFGAESGKYEDRNWESGNYWGKYIAPLFRHTTAWVMGKDKDEESGLSHLAHAGCCILFLLAYQKRNVGVDDRVKGE